ncbi:hypothetical protein D3C86_1167180 [compost metagenome]
MSCKAPSPVCNPVSSGLRSDRHASRKKKHRFHPRDRTPRQAGFAVLYLVRRQHEHHHHRLRRVAGGDGAQPVLECAGDHHRLVAGGDFHGLPLGPGTEAGHSANDPEPGAIRRVGGGVAAAVRDADLPGFLRQQHLARGPGAGVRQPAADVRQYLPDRRVVLRRRALWLSVDSPLAEAAVDSVAGGVRGRHGARLAVADPGRTMAADRFLVVEVPGGGEHRRDLATVLRALRRRLLTLPAEQHADRPGVLVQLRRHGQRWCVDDDSRGDPERRHRRLLQQRRRACRRSVRRWRGAAVRLHRLRPGVDQRVQPVRRVHVDHHRDRAFRPTQGDPAGTRCVHAADQPGGHGPVHHQSGRLHQLLPELHLLHELLPDPVDGDQSGGLLLPAQRPVPD